MEQLPLFVYGTLRPGAGNYALLRQRVIPGRTVKALLSGYQMYSLGRFPGIIQENGVTVPVQGDLLWLDPPYYEEMMVVVDRYEGEGFTFHRHTFVVLAGYEGRQEAAWVYLADPLVLDIQASRRIESNDWFKFAYKG